jgi:hypothetical protein
VILLLRRFYGNFTGVMPETVNDLLHLTPGELSGILLISDIEISRLARRGILPRIPNPTKSNSYLYPLVDCAREYVRFLKSAGQQDRDRYWKARAQSEKGKAHAITSANAVRDGQLLDAREVETRQRELAHTLKQRLAVIPGRIADALAENGERGRIEQVVTSEITAALAAISKP